MKLTYGIFMMKSVLTPFSMKLESLPQFIHSSNIHSIFFWLLFSGYTNTYVVCVCVEGVCVLSVCCLNFKPGFKVTFTWFEQACVTHWDKCWPLYMFPLSLDSWSVSVVHLCYQNSFPHIFTTVLPKFTEYNQSVDTYFDSLRA